MTSKVAIRVVQQMEGTVTKVEHNGWVDTIEPGEEVEIDYWDTSSIIITEEEENI